MPPEADATAAASSAFISSRMLSKAVLFFSMQTWRASNCNMGRERVGCSNNSSSANILQGG